MTTHSDRDGSEPRIDPISAVARGVKAARDMQETQERVAAVFAQGAPVGPPLHEQADRDGDNVPSQEVLRAYAEAIYDAVVDHPMWIGADSQPLDYNPEREARIGDFVDDAARAVMAVADREQATLRATLARVEELAPEEPS